MRAEAPLAYRRLFVPAGREELWPKDADVIYRRVPKEQFEYLRSLLEDTTGAAGAAHMPRVREAQYLARLDRGTLVGTGQLSVDHPGSELGLLPLSPCNAALGSIRWNGTPGQEAVAGLDPSGRFAVLVERSGTLEFQWSQRPSHRSRSQQTYLLQLPAAPRRTLRLEIPETYVPQLQHGAVLPPEPAVDGTRVWTLLLTTADSETLTLRRTGQREDEPVVAVRQSFTYVVSPRGVDVSLLMPMDVDAAPLSYLDVDLSPGLQLLGVYLGETRIAWQPDASRPRVRLLFPAPLLGSGRVLRMAAYQPLDLGQRFLLPEIRPVNVFWSEGSAVLRILPPLDLQLLETQDCRQWSPLAGGELQLQWFSPQARAWISVAPPMARSQVDTAAAVRLRGTTLQARVAARCSQTSGQTFLLTGEVAPGWSILSVESQPPGQIERWRVQADDAQQRLLRVELRHPVVPDRPLELVVQAQRLSGVAGPLTLAELWPLTLTANSHRRWLAVDAAPDPLRVEDFQQARPVSVALLDADARRLLGDAAGLVFELGASDAALTLRTDAAPRKLVAHMRVETTVGEAHVHEQVHIAATPEGPGVEQLLVQFSEQRAAPLEWTLGPGTHQPPRARRLTAQELAERGFPSSGETWLLELPQRLSEPFEIHAVRTVAASPRLAVNLVSVPSASEQTGLVRLTFSHPAQWSIDCRRLRPVPDEPPDAARRHAPAAVFRYVPSRDAAPLMQDDPPLRIVQSSGRGSDAVVWSAVLHTWLSPTGTAEHLAAYRLQWSRPGTLHLTLPQDAQVMRLLVNGHPATPELDGRRLAVALPGDQRHPVVHVLFRTAWQGASLMACGSLPLPQPDLPVLRREAHVWAPPEFDVRASAELWDHTTTGPTDWTHRLGGLLRSPTPRPLDPLSRLGWCWTPDRRAALASAEAAAADCLQALSEAIRAARDVQPSQPSATWRNVLEQAAAALQQRDVRLLLDADALALRGLRPGAAIAPQPAEDPAASQWLARSGLALLVRGPVVVLTSDVRAAALDDELAGLSAAHTYGVISGPVADFLDHLDRTAAAAASQPDRASDGDAAANATTDNGARREITDSDAPEDHPTSGDATRGDATRGDTTPGDTTPGEAAEAWLGTPGPILYLVPPGQWPEILADPWSHAGQGIQRPAWSGWAQRVFHTLGQEPLPTICVTRRDTLRSLGLAVMVLAAAIAAWLWRRQRVAYAAVLAALLAASLLIPDVLLDVTARSVPGFLLGTLGGLLWPSGRCGARGAAVREAARDAVGSTRTAGVAGAMVALAACWGAWCGLRCLAAQEPAVPAAASSDEAEPEPMPAAVPVHKVFVPVDEQRRPVDAFYWVAEPLLQEMQRRAAPDSAASSRAASRSASAAASGPSPITTSGASAGSVRQARSKGSPSDRVVSRRSAAQSGTARARARPRTAPG